MTMDMDLDMDMGIDMGICVEMDIGTVIIRMGISMDRDMIDM
jgi:hypothetical protein